MCCKTQAKYLYLFSFQPFIDQRLASLTGSFFKQSIFKQILTEGILVCVQHSGQTFCNIIMFTMIKPCLYFHCFFLSGEKYVMTVFGVLNFGDQGNTACVNIYMHVMSKTFLFSFVFYLLLLYSVHGDFFISMVQIILLLCSQRKTIYYLPF